MKNNVRCIGGPLSGETFVIDAPRFSIPEHPDFAACLKCPIPEFPDAPLMHNHTYRVHPLRFDTGHVHYYAAQERIPFVQILNQLWYEFSRNQNEKT